MIKVSKTFPSSQSCSCCGSENPEVKNLKIRKWECPSCHAVHDRDENAALKLKQEAPTSISGGSLPRDPLFPYPSGAYSDSYVELLHNVHFLLLYNFPVSGLP